MALRFRFNLIGVFALNVALHFDHCPKGARALQGMFWVVGIVCNAPALAGRHCVNLYPLQVIVTVSRVSFNCERVASPYHCGGYASLLSRHGGRGHIVKYHFHYTHGSILLRVCKDINLLSFRYYIANNY